MDQLLLIIVVGMYGQTFMEGVELRIEEGE